MIVCWIHNWPECPEWIEVVELSREVEKIGGSRVIGGSEDFSAEEYPYCSAYFRRKKKSQRLKPDL